MSEFLQNSESWLWPTARLLGALAGGVVIHGIVFAGLTRLAARTRNDTDGLIVKHGRGPARVIVPLLVLLIFLPGTILAPEAETVVRRIVALGLVFGVAWLMLAALNVAVAVVGQRFDITQPDNLTARRIHTQVNVVRKIGTVVVVVLALAGALMMFPSLRTVGFSLFASAGVAGLVIGLAARPTLSNLIAGLQIALTDPIRIDDVVIVEGEWGWIEEINTTYVVVRVWDLRRLIVPLTRFIEQPFQNWTRRSADILGTVFLYMDYTVPIDEVRAELRRIVEGSEHWDGKVCGLQVTNATDRTVELRALVSAATSPAAWELRCLVREKLIGFLKSRYPDSLPHVRAELMSDAGPTAPGAATAATA